MRNNIKSNDLSGMSTEGYTAECRQNIGDELIGGFMPEQAQYFMSPEYIKRFLEFNSPFATFEEAMLFQTEGTPDGVVGWIQDGKWTWQGKNDFEPCTTGIDTEPYPISLQSLSELPIPKTQFTPSLFDVIRKRDYPSKLLPKIKPMFNWQVIKTANTPVEFEE